MKEYVKINLASPAKILNWTERALATGELIGEINKSMRNINFYRKIYPF